MAIQLNIIMKMNLYFLNVMKMILRMEIIQID